MTKVVNSCKKSKYFWFYSPNVLHLHSFVQRKHNRILKTGIVFEGGGMRGLFSTGIADVLLEEGITVDGMVGVSAGACLCCNYKSRQVGRALRYNVLLRNDPKYMSVRNLIKTGDFIGADYAYHYIPTYVDYFDREAFKANPMVFEQKRLGKTLLIFPPHSLDIGRIEQDEAKMRAVHQLGIETARAHLSQIREFLNV